MGSGDLFVFGANACVRFGRTLRSGTVFAKFLTPNDDSGRHGVLVPSEAYEHFPTLEIRDSRQNTTRLFDAFDLVSGLPTELAYKYYQRYPERRITKLNAKFNDKSNAPIIAVFLKAAHDDGSSGIYVDCINAADANYVETLVTIFGADAETQPGNFVVRNVDTPAFSYDEPLTELAALFDDVRGQGWIESLRDGTTGIGYTFETLVGIEENNRQEADYKGIEVKCKQKKDGGGASGKINLFQKAPKWHEKLTAKQRIKKIGAMNDSGRLSCFSQVTTTPNNLLLNLRIHEEQRQIDLQKDVELLGHWPYQVLEACLAKKHSRAVFIKANVRKTNDKTYYQYDELIYCESPSIQNFVNLILARDLVFEFMMSERENGTVRNHGYPWRLNSEDILRELFALRIQLR